MMQSYETPERTILVGELERGLKLLRFSILIVVMSYAFYVIRTIINYANKLDAAPWSFYYQSGPGTAALVFMNVFTAISSLLLMIGTISLAIIVLQLRGLMKSDGLDLSIAGIIILISYLISLLMQIVYLIIITTKGFSNISDPIVTYFLVAYQIIYYLNRYVLPGIALFLLGLSYNSMTNIGGYSSSFCILPIFQVIFGLIFALLMIGMAVPTSGTKWIITFKVFDCVTAFIIMLANLEVALKTSALNAPAIIDYRLKR